MQRSTSNPGARFLAWANAVALILVLVAGQPVQAQPPSTREQALQALNEADAERRLEALVWLAAAGTADDANAVLPRLSDPHPAVRRFAVALVWQLWGRSGDAAIDTLYQQGLHLMEAGELPQAVQLFSDIIARRPDFAEAWNKRATLYFMQGEHELSMQDCDEVLKRVPLHFGALSGYAHMLAEQGQLERSLDFLERAFRVNPNMPNAEWVIEDLRRQIDAKRKKSV